MQEEQTEFAAFIGIDWADQKHDVCLTLPGSEVRELSVIEHRPAAIDAWRGACASALKARSLLSVSS